MLGPTHHYKVASQLLSAMQDGYAVLASDGPGEYVVAFSAHAGHQQPQLESGSVAYITTGEQSVVLCIPRHLCSYAFCSRRWLSAGKESVPS